MALIIGAGVLGFLIGGAVVAIVGATLGHGAARLSRFAKSHP